MNWIMKQYWEVICPLVLCHRSVLKRQNSRCVTHFHMVWARYSKNRWKLLLFNTTLSGWLTHEGPPCSLLSLSMFRHCSHDYPSFSEGNLSLSFIFIFSRGKIPVDCLCFFVFKLISPQILVFLTSWLCCGEEPSIDGDLPPSMSSHKRQINFLAIETHTPRCVSVLCSYCALEILLIHRFNLMVYVKL